MFISKVYCNSVTRDEYGRVPIHYAAQNGHPDIVRLLMKAFACDANIEGPNLLDTPSLCMSEWSYGYCAYANFRIYL